MPPPCLQHDVGHVQAARHHQHDDQAEADRELVGHHLRRRAHRAEEGVLRVGRPAGDDHAVDLERGDRHQEQQAGVDVGEREFGPERHHHPGRQRRHDRHHRSDDVQDLVRLARENDLLEHQLEGVGDRLQQPAGTDAVRPEADVHEADHLAFPQVRYATHNSSGSTTRTIFTRFHTTGQAPPSSDWPVVVIEAAADPLFRVSVRCRQALATETAPNIAGEPGGGRMGGGRADDAVGDRVVEHRFEDRFAAALRQAHLPARGQAERRQRRCVHARLRSARVARLLQAVRAAHHRVDRSRCGTSAMRSSAPAASGAASSRSAPSSAGVAGSRRAATSRAERGIAHRFGGVEVEAGKLEQVAQHAQHLPGRTRVAEGTDHAVEGLGRAFAVHEGAGGLGERRDRQQAVGELEELGRAVRAERDHGVGFRERGARRLRHAVVETGFDVEQHVGRQGLVHHVAGVAPALPRHRAGKPAADGIGRVAQMAAGAAAGRCDRTRQLEDRAVAVALRPRHCPAGSPCANPTAGPPRCASRPRRAPRPTASAATASPRDCVDRHQHLREHCRPLAGRDDGLRRHRHQQVVVGGVQHRHRAPPLTAWRTRAASSG